MKNKGLSDKELIAKYEAGEIDMDKALNNLKPLVEKEYLNIHTTHNKETFTIHGCGTFSETKKVLSKSEAAMLYVLLHKWLFPEENIKQ